MSWIELDDGILDHPKFIRAIKLGGSEALHLWLALRVYCAKHLTDGSVPRDMLAEVRGPQNQAKRERALDALLTVGLLEEDGESGYRLHDFLQWSKSRAEILAARQRNAARQDRFRVTHAENGSVSNGVTTALVTASVTLPSPLLSSPDPLRSQIPLTPSESAPPGADLARADLDSFAPDPPKERKKREKRPTRAEKWVRFPVEFEPDESHRRLASSLGLNLAAQLALIRDHEFTKPKSDPAATLRNWLRNAVKFGSGPSVGAGSRRPFRPDGVTEMAEMNAAHDARRSLSEVEWMLRKVRAEDAKRAANG